MDGIAKAKQKGVRFGAQRKLTIEQISELKNKRKEGVLNKSLDARLQIIESKHLSLSRPKNFLML